MLYQVYGESTVSRVRVSQWHKTFDEGRDEMKDDHRSCRPSASMTDDNIGIVTQTLGSDRRLTILMIASQLDVRKDGVWEIITEDLGLQKIFSKMVPRLQNAD